MQRLAQTKYPLPDSNRCCRTENPTTTPEIIGENDGFENRAAQGAAVGAENEPWDADLEAVVTAWPALPDAIKAGIVAMVRVAGAGGGK